MNELLQGFVGALGGGLITAAILLKGGVKWFADRAAASLDARLRLTYDQQLERFRSDLSAHQGSISSAVGASVSANMALHARRIAAVEAIWNAILQIRQNTSTMLFGYQILVPSEYGLVVEKPELFGSITQAEMQRRLIDMPQVENNRPFVTPDVWNLFFVYQAFAYRSAWRAIEGVHVRDRLPLWDHDEEGKIDHTRKILIATLSNDDIAYVDRFEIGAPQRALERLEAKFLSIAGASISGSHVADLSVEETKRLSEAARLAAAPPHPPDDQSFVLS